MIKIIALLYFCNVEVSIGSTFVLQNYDYVWTEFFWEDGVYYECRRGKRRERQPLDLEQEMRIAPVSGVLLLLILRF